MHTSVKIIAASEKGFPFDIECTTPEVPLFLSILNKINNNFPFVCTDEELIN